MGNADDRLEYPLWLRPLAERADEGPVDLQHVHRKAAERTERGIADAEVVQRHLGAERPEVAERIDREAGFTGDRALCDLEANRARRERGAFERLSDLADQCGRQLGRREVDGDREVLEPTALPPVGELPAGRLDHPLADRDDQTGLLCNRNELRGTEQAAPWMLPANKCLHREDALRAEIHLGLILERELVSLQCPRQLRL